MTTSVDTQINRNTSRIHGIDGNIAAARAQYNAAAARRRKFEARKREIERIQHNMSNSFDGVVNAARNKQTRVKRYMENATAGLSHEGQLTGILQRDMEQHTESDANGRQVHAYLRSEIARCDSEINAAQADMNSSKSQINNLNSQRRTLVNQNRALTAKRS